MTAIGWPIRQLAATVSCRVCECHANSDSNSDRCQCRWGSRPVWILPHTPPPHSHYIAVWPVHNSTAPATKEVQNVYGRGEYRSRSISISHDHIHMQFIAKPAVFHDIGCVTISTLSLLFALFPHSRIPIPVHITIRLSSADADETVGTFSFHRDSVPTYEVRNNGGDQGIEIGNVDIAHMNEPSLNGVSIPDSFYESEDEDENGPVEVIPGTGSMMASAATLFYFYASKKSTKTMFGLVMVLFFVLFFAGIGGIASHNQKAAAMRYAVTGIDCAESEPSRKSNSSKTKTPSSSSKKSKMRNLVRTMTHLRHL